ncbi:Cryptochrome/photolyase FAD-binding domain-containing protein [Fragilariopsis cylindrus CCMP1102]|uniref:Cryptochrome/photolyase FAD-binding domain-containing protein n=1 Tax=Fragilariopsis cylindrus CCMP1102 TaxID=635003 RepID=A0A1E7FL92_9STRA|nr:Cryptochrome/photolyase FAD-binding domain-containing protein [Fragilariopsis cylindrus CCMP1102]|eukprot:OEU18916.1 Cryptochrome/photolyase FAD-binding domain-containing protein [Fragilariopsis cylindrus CCMP1102]
MSNTRTGIGTPLPPRRRRRRLVWHRTKDLRYHDHPFYCSDGECSNTPITSTITSVFIFDDQVCCGLRPSTCRPKEWMAVNIGPHGARVLLESVADLRQRRPLLSTTTTTESLIVRTGSTVPILLKLIDEIINISEDDSTTEYEICWNEEPGVYEMELSREARQAISTRFPNVRIRTTMSCTLYHPDDLPRTKNDWQPITMNTKKKKEKKQRQRQQHSNSNSIINISSERWNGMPQIMGEFRRTAREKARVRPCFELFSSSNSKSGIDPGEIPTLESLLEPLLLYAMDDEQEDRKPIMGLPSSIIREVCHHAIRIYHENNKNPKMTTTVLAPQHNRRGGESHGLAHLDNFCRNYASKAQRNLACVDNHQSSHLSHYLAFGCLSPRTVEVTTTTTTTTAAWLISHMTMRDFFLYTCLASEKQFYRLEGIPVNKKYAESIRWKSFVVEDNDDVIVVDDSVDDETTTTTHNLWKDWALGNTGLPLVDAAMKEMIQTGYCSNRVRQNVASVLTKDFNIDWRAGAEWFQFLLHDHCVGANWGNWLYFSGVGSDPKQRHFCTVSQALKYDKDGTYVKKWLPQLNASSFCSVTSTKNKYYEEEFHLRPWDFDSSWKRPPISVDSQYAWRDLQRLKETGRLMPF